MINYLAYNLLAKIDNGFANAIISTGKPSIRLRSRNIVQWY